MLRRRRSSIAPLTEMQPARVWQVRKEEVRRPPKFKMSPFPEFKGHFEFEKENSHMTPGNVKASLTFSDVSPKSAPSPPTQSLKAFPTNLLRPGEVLEVQKRLTPQVARQQKCTAENVLKVSHQPNWPEEGEEVDLGGDTQPSAAIRSMWDSVVSWMKMAVDFIATEEAVPAATPSPSTRRKKRPFTEVSADVPAVKVPRLHSERQREGEEGPGQRCMRRDLLKGKGKRRVSLGAFRTVRKNGGQSGPSLEPIKEFKSSPSQSPVPKTHSAPEFKSPTTLLTQDLSSTLQVDSPSQNVNTAMKPGVCSTLSLLSSAKRFQSSHNGLNTILDGSPDSPPMLASHRKIRWPALRVYYGNSVNSPNVGRGMLDAELQQETEKISPQLTGRGQAATGSLVPPPPPPAPPTPTIPLPPPPPGIPLPPPTPKLPADQGDEPVDLSRDLLQKMQHRLRRRIKRKGGEEQTTGAERGVELVGVKTDIKVSRWAEIQAHSRKVPLQEFLALAEQKRQETQAMLEALQLGLPTTMAEVVHTVELLQEASQWFPGGSKEMRDVLPLYKSLERKIEALNEFVQICSEMDHVTVPSGEQAIHYSNLHHHLSCIREEFEAKHRHWGTIVLTNAQSWCDLGLPVCGRMLGKAQSYLCSLVVRFVHLSTEEAAKIGGILVSIKCFRTTQVKEKLKDGMSLILEALPYFTMEGFTRECGQPQCNCQAVEEDADHQLEQEIYSLPSLLKLAVEAVLSYVSICLEQFEGYVCHGNRQVVCEHFEGVLKMMHLLASLVAKLPNFSSEAKSNGTLSVLPRPSAEDLGSAVYSSCVKLIRHIASQAQPYVTSHSQDQSNPKEIVLWMMFGCKYVNHTLQMLGSEQADERGVQSLLDDLQQLENLLPD